MCIRDSRQSTESTDSSHDVRNLPPAHGSGDTDTPGEEETNSSEEETLLDPPQGDEGVRAGPSGEGGSKRIAGHTPPQGKKKKKKQKGPDRENPFTKKGG